jgi:NADH-quinone oxidoreductase subunit A
LGEYFYLLVFIGLGILVPAGGIATMRMLGPKRPSAVKSAPYECGIETEGESRMQFNIRYYLFALVFIAFDIEAVFLFPWAVAYKQLALFGFVQMMLFIGILLVGFAYAWKKQALEWR